MKDAWDATDRDALHALLAMSGIAGFAGVGSSYLKDRNWQNAKDQYQQNANPAPEIRIPIPYHTQVKKPKSKPLLLVDKQADLTIGDSPLARPWFMFSAVPAAVGSYAIGKKMSDQLMASRRQKSLDDEVEEAKKKFEKELAATHQVKVASDKEALVPELIGGISLLSGGMAALGANKGYDSARKTSGRSLLEEALKQRQRDILAASPMTPVVVPVSIGKHKSDDREEKDNSD